MLLSMARLYDANGRLLEVTTSTGIRAEAPVLPAAPAAAAEDQDGQ
jgi:hypothetical protein